MRLYILTFCGLLGVVPVLTGPLQALLAILPVLILALLTAILALLRPQVLLAGVKLVWRLKFSLSLLVISGIGIVWAAKTFWPSPATAPVPPAQRGADWPMLRGGPARTGAVAGTVEPDRASVNWVYRRDDAAFFSSPAVVGNRIYASTAQMATYGGGSGEIVCLTADTGIEVWRAAPKDYRATFSSPAVSGNYLVCGEGLHATTDARVICLDLTPGREGQTLWTHRTNSHVECAPVIHDGRVYVGAGEDGYYCLQLEGDREGGAKVLWHVPGDEYPDAETSLIVHDGRVYAGLGASGQGQALCVLDAETGRELHRVHTGMPVFSPPAIADGKLYVGMGTGDYVHTAEEIGQQPCGALWCCDLQTMNVDWKFPVGRTVLGAPAVSGDHIYFGSRDGFLYCIDSGGNLVERRDMRVPVPTSPAVTENFIYVVTEWGRFHCLDRSSLQSVWEYQLGTEPLFISSPAVACGHVYVGTQHDGLMCIGRPDREEPVALSPGHPGGTDDNLDNAPLPERSEVRAPAVDGNLYIAQMLAWWNSLCLSIGDFLFGWTLHLPSDLTLLAIAGISAVILILVRRLTTDQDLLGRVARDKKTLKQLIRQAKKNGDREALQRHRKTLSMASLVTFRSEWLPMMVSIPPIALLATWWMFRLEVEMKPLELFGVVPGIDALGIPPWLIAYLVIVLPLVPLLKRLLRVY